MRLLHLLALFALAAISSPLAHALAIEVNGVCYVGYCASPDVLSIGQTVTTPFNFTVTSPNGDQYQVFGAVTMSRSGAGISKSGYRMATYLGDTQGMGLSASDTLMIQFLQNHEEAPPSGAETEGVTPVFEGPYGAASSVSVQDMIAGPRYRYSRYSGNVSGGGQ
jgi:hypothetical protein